MAAVGRFRQRVPVRVTQPTFAFIRMGGMYLTPSTESRYVMRFHAVCVRSHTFDCQQLNSDEPAVDHKLV